MKIRTPHSALRNDERGPGIDQEPERSGYRPPRWLRPCDTEEEDWSTSSRMARARLRRRYWRFLGQLGFLNVTSE